MTASPLYLEDRIQRLELAGDQMHKALLELHDGTLHTLSTMVVASWVRDVCQRAARDWEALH